MWHISRVGGLYIVGQGPSDSKSNRLHVHIFRCCFDSFEVYSIDSSKRIGNQNQGEPVDVRDCREITDHFRRIYRIYPNFVKENRRMSTCDRLDLQTLGSQPVMPKNLTDHWLVILMRSPTSTGYFSILTTGSSATNRRFSPSSAPHRCACPVSYYPYDGPTFWPP